MDKKTEGITIKTTKEPKINRRRKKRIFWYSDFLRSTGFGNVAEELITRLNATGKYDFQVLGINHNGSPYNIEGGRYYHLKDIPVFPASNGFIDPLGLDRLSDMVDKMNFDLFFAIQDSFNMAKVFEAITDAKQKKGFKYILYTPIDGDIHPHWVTHGMEPADKVVTYTEYGKNIISSISPHMKPLVIPHGTNLDNFYPMGDEERTLERKWKFSLSPEEEKDMFIISNINRNQPRKDLARTIRAFVKFCDDYPEVNTKLYLHCLVNDQAGIRIDQFVAKYVPEKYLNRISTPGDENMGNLGVSLKDLRALYCCSDVVTSTSLGEGWGLSNTEAMACKVPVVMPNNTAFTEIIGPNEERGYLAKCGGDVNMYKTLVLDNNLSRPVTDINDLVKKWKHVYDNKKEAQEKAEKAFQWVTNKTWDSIAEEWDKLITQTLSE